MAKFEGKMTAAPVSSNSEITYCRVTQPGNYSGCTLESIDISKTYKLGKNNKPTDQVIESLTFTYNTGETDFLNDESSEELPVKIVENYVSLLADMKTGNIFWTHENAKMPKRVKGIIGDFDVTDATLELEYEGEFEDIPFFKKSVPVLSLKVNGKELIGVTNLDVMVGRLDSGWPKDITVAQGRTKRAAPGT